MGTFFCEYYRKKSNGTKSGVDVGGTRIVISKDKLPDLSKTINQNDESCDMTDNITPYTDSDCISVRIHLKLQVVDQFTNLVDDTKNEEE